MWGVPAKNVPEWPVMQFCWFSQCCFEHCRLHSHTVKRTRENIGHTLKDNKKNKTRWPYTSLILQSVSGICNCLAVSLRFLSAARVRHTPASTWSPKREWMQAELHYRPFWHIFGWHSPHVCLCFSFQNCSMHIMQHLVGKVSSKQLKWYKHITDWYY